MAQKKPRIYRGFFGAQKSALAELEGAAGLRLAVLLTLDHTRVAGEEPGGLQDAAQITTLDDMLAKLMPDYEHIAEFEALLWRWRGHTSQAMSARNSAPVRNKPMESKPYRPVNSQKIASGAVAAQLRVAA